MRSGIKSLIVTFLVIIALTPIIVINAYACSEEQPRYSITINQVNGHSGSANMPSLTNPIHIEGKVGSTKYAGSISQYRVQIDWGDGTIDRNSDVDIARDGDGFKGTWSSLPDHTYLASGTYTITAKLYHQMPPGAESADAQISLTIHLNLGVEVTIATSPPGLSISVDSHSYVAPQIFEWSKYSAHTISTTSPQQIEVGTRYVWVRWSDCGAITHSITATQKTVTAYFLTQHELTVQTSPPNLASIAGAGWKNGGTTVSLAAPAVEGYTFQYWTVDGAQRGTSSHISVTMCEPHEAVAFYCQNGEPSPSPSTSPTPSPSPSSSPNPSPSPSASPSPSPSASPSPTLSPSPSESPTPSTSPDPSSSPSPSVSPSPSPSISPSPAPSSSPSTSPSPSPSASQSPNPSQNPSPSPSPTPISSSSPSPSPSQSPSPPLKPSPSPSSSPNPTPTPSPNPSFSPSPTPSPTESPTPSSNPTPTGPTASPTQTPTSNPNPQTFTITFTQSNISSDYTGTVLTVDDANYDIKQLPASFIWNAGSIHSFAFNSPLTAGTTRYVWSSTAGGLTSAQSGSLTVKESGTVTGNFNVQYKLTFTQTGLDSTATGTVASIEGSSKTFNALPYTTEWVNSGSTHSFAYSSAVQSSASGKQFILTSVSGSESGFTVSAPATIFGNFKTQYKVTFSQAGLDSSATGTVLIVAGSGKNLAGLPFVSDWIDAGSQLSYSYQTVVASSVDGERFELGNVQGSNSPITVNGASNVVGVYAVRFHLDVVSSFGDPHGSGWYAANALAQFGVTTPVDQGNRTLRVLLNWFGDASVYEPSGSIVMSKPASVTAAWETQYLVTFNTTLPNLTILSVPGVPTTLPAGMDVFGAYYPAGGHVSAGPAPDTVSGSDATKYTLKGWTLDSGALSTAASVSFVVDGPRDVAVVFDTNHLLTVNAVGVADPFEASVTITASPSVTLSLTPSSPACNWLLQGAYTQLFVTQANRIGHGEWAVFEEWAGQSGHAEELAFTVEAPTSVDAAFFKVNPVAQSLPYSVIAALGSMGLLAWGVRKKKNPAWRTRLSVAVGAVIMGVALGIAAFVSSSVATGYGINAAELLDFTNWAVVFLAFEASVFMVGSTYLVRKVQRKKASQPQQTVPQQTQRTGFVQ